MPADLAAKRETKALGGVVPVYVAGSGFACVCLSGVLSREFIQGYGAHRLALVLERGDSAPSLVDGAHDESHHGGGQSKFAENDSLAELREGKCHRDRAERRPEENPDCPAAHGSLFVSHVEELVGHALRQEDTRAYSTPQGRYEET